MSSASNYFKEKPAHLSVNARNRVHSQQIDQRANPVLRKVQNAQILMYNAKRSDGFCLVEDDWKSTSGLDENGLPQTKANNAFSAREYVPIYKNEPNVQDLRGKSMPRRAPQSQMRDDMNGSRKLGSNQSRVFHRRHDRKFFSLRNQGRTTKQTHISPSPGKPSNKMMMPSYSEYADCKFSPVDLNKTQPMEGTQGDVTATEKPKSEKHYIYIIPDGVDILKDKYQIFKQDIRKYIDNMLFDKEEIVKKFPYLTIKEKDKLLMPSEQMKEQVYRQFLSDIGEMMRTGKEYVALFDTKGNKIKDLMEIHDDVKVFIISESETCKGVTGIEMIEKEHYKEDENREKAKKAFIQACEKWIENHRVELMAAKKDDAI